ncbi:hypothetical protein GCM10027445_07970 [Amycolatopsis endophytica]
MPGIDPIAVAAPEGQTSSLTPRFSKVRAPPASRPRRATGNGTGRIDEKAPVLANRVNPDISVQFTGRLPFLISAG